MAYSTQLPTGQEAFVFDDTLIGTTTPDGALTHINGLVHNSELVGNLSSLSSNYGGTYPAPSPLIPDTNTPGTYLWEVASTDVENGQQLVFVNEYHELSPGDDVPTGKSAIAVFSLPTSGLPRIPVAHRRPHRPHRDDGPAMGNAMTHDATYNYIYGITANQVHNEGWMNVARVPLNETATVSDWQYWNGTTWVSGEANAAIAANSNEFSGVTPQPGGGYVSVQKSGGGSTPTTIDVAYACAPQGPWSNQVAVYTPPEIKQYAPDEIAYTPNFHPDLAGTGPPVISYSVDNTAAPLTTLGQNLNQYRPRFLQLNFGPAITKISPTSGPPTGNTTVSITGTNFTGATAVDFGTVAATNYKVNSSTSITATSPPQSAGPVDVTVTTPLGTSPDTSADQYIYLALPSVSAVSPPSGPTAGGTSVTITGSSFTGATKVLFGTVAATNYTVNSFTSVTATSPPQSAGPVDVTVTTPLGTSPDTSADQYIYLALPSVSAVSPPSGLTAGGTSVTITGTNLAGASSVQFGSTAARISADGDSSVTATSPPESPGPVDVTVTTPGGTSPNSSADTYTFVLPPYSPLTPVRICDTRAGEPLEPHGRPGSVQRPGGVATSGTTIPAGGTQTIEVAGHFNVPSDATAVVLNVAVANAAASGYLTIFPAGATTRPVTTNVNYNSGEVVPNLVEVGTGTGGQVSIYSLSKADVVVDLEGYVSPYGQRRPGGRALQPAVISRPPV